MRTYFKQKFDSKMKQLFNIISPISCYWKFNFTSKFLSFRNIISSPNNASLLSLLLPACCWSVSPWSEKKLFFIESGLGLWIWLSATGTVLFRFSDCMNKVSISMLVVKVASPGHKNQSLWPLEVSTSVSPVVPQKICLAFKFSPCVIKAHFRMNGPIEPRHGLPASVTPSSSWFVCLACSFAPG